MNFFKTALISIAALSAPISISAQQYQGVIDKTVALIGNDMIQLSTIESEVQMQQLQGHTAGNNLRCEILENMMTHKLFAAQALIDSLVVNPLEIESQLTAQTQRAVSQLGSEKAAEEYFKKPLYKVQDDWREVLREQSLVQQMQGSITETVTELRPSDVKEYYRKTPQDSLPIISTQYKFRQIALYPDKAAAELEVKEFLLGLRARIMEGERFSSLATLYSQDPGTSARGGELRMASSSMYWPEFSDAAMTLKEGQVSQIVQTPDGFHLIQMIEKQGDMFNARHILRQPQYTSTDMTTAFDKLDSIKTLIVADSLSFEYVAYRFSQDVMSRTNGGLVAEENSGSPHFDKDLLKPSDYNIIRNLEVGDVSEPFESTDNEGRNGNTIYKIIKLEEIIPSHVATYEDDFNVLYDEAMYMMRMKAINDFIKKKQETTYIKVDPMFEHCPFLKEGWIK